jgi:hypothetical protein
MKRLSESPPIDSSKLVLVKKAHPVIQSTGTGVVFCRGVLSIVFPIYLIEGCPNQLL